MSKLVEKIVLKRLYKLDEKLKLTLPFQFGFRKGHSTTHQVVRILIDIKAHINRNQNTVFMLLDMQKAFDRGRSDGLIYKLKALNVPPYICKLLHSYLTERSFQVKINNTKSQYKPILAGVSQGSVLGPKLYTIFISDLPVLTKTKTAVYADNTAIYSHSYY